MRRFRSVSLAIVATTCIAASAARSATPQAEIDVSQSLTIRIYDYSGVSVKTLTQAFRETERIYAKVGVTLAVVQCWPVGSEHILDPGCAPLPDPTVIQLRLLPERMALPSQSDKQVFGFAATALPPESANVANVYYERVKWLASEWDYRGYLEAPILGHVIAHGIGHLLLSTGSHSRRGIMHVPWIGPQLALAHNGGLVFTPEESLIIRGNVAGRVRAASAKRASSSSVAGDRPSLRLTVVRGEPNTPQQLAVRIYDHASVPGQALTRAFQETERIFRKSGVNVTLMRCRISLTERVFDPRCGKSPGPTVIRVNILPERMAVRLQKDNQIFGLAALTTEQDFGVVAFVFYDGVVRFAADSNFRGSVGEGIVLGHVVAHEIGHLLLGGGSHSPRGIMRIPWEQAEIIAAYKGTLRFTREQADQIRGAIAARFRAED